MEPFARKLPQQQLRRNHVGGLNTNTEQGGACNREPEVDHKLFDVRSPCMAIVVVGRLLRGLQRTDWMFPMR